MLRNEIALLAKETIDKIAAGEVVERPASVAKELVENAIDAGATAITVEIDGGGKKLLRVSDNGCGIPKEECAIAFLRHATSKLRLTSELESIGTLGFRGEALSSIAAVAHVELTTKPAEQLTGVRYAIEGGKELYLQEVGAPNGTTILVQHLFYNTPARLKFLKTDATEGSYIADLMERLALSHPEISFTFISSGRERLHTSGNGRLKDVIYQIYGKQISANMLPLEAESEAYAITGFVGNATVARGNRSLETFFVQGRYIKSSLLQKALEEGYEGYLMQHQYPFCVLFVTAKGAAVDVNVHPTKQEVRFDNEAAIYSLMRQAVAESMSQREDIAQVKLVEDEGESEAAEGVVAENTDAPVPELIASVVKNAEAGEMDADLTVGSSTAGAVSQELELTAGTLETAVAAEQFEPQQADARATDAQTSATTGSPATNALTTDSKTTEFTHENPQSNSAITTQTTTPASSTPTYEQQAFLTPLARKGHRIIGQLFDTYWLVEFDGKLYIIDQHAAHEKVLYERMMADMASKVMTSQLLSPPIIVSLSLAEQQILEEYGEAFTSIGFAVEAFGGADYAINAIPGNMYSLDARQLFMDLLAECGGLRKGEALEIIKDKVASMSCKAAVKGHNKLSRQEIETLIEDLLSLDNPYHCPHGRPTIISMSKYEIEKKFKRIV